MVMMQSYGDHNVDDDPVLVLSCGHIFTRETLDGWIDVKEAFVLSAEGETVG